MAWYLWAIVLALAAVVVLYVAGLIAERRDRQGAAAVQRRAVARQQAISEARTMQAVQDSVEQMIRTVRGPR